ncbi:MAG: GntR family transcriptional regulator [Bifidobacteriaceae bacterium]|nr:GntR family transcriptional regulator [Bifidobacteriaceae bacterium]
MKKQPKYQTLANAVRQRAQGLPTGTKLPSERALAAEFGVSVGTARQALTFLATEGWVRRNPASGTVTSRPPVSMGPTLTSFTEDMARRGLRATSSVLRCEIVKPDLETVASLALRPGEEVLCVDRLRFADGSPVCVEQSVFPGRLAKLLRSADLSESVHRVLREDGVVPRSSQRRIRAVPASLRDSQLLELPIGAPLLEITDDFADTLGRPMQHALSRYRFDCYEVLTVVEAVFRSSPSQVQPRS